MVVVMTIDDFAVEDNAISEGGWLVPKTYENLSKIIQNNSIFKCL